MNRRAFLAAPLAALAGCSRPGARVVVYCAQDREFAEGLLADFTRQTGLAVVPKFDTEANKSVSLAVELEREAGRPRCDVHWNNEPVGTVRLARKGVYERYESPNAAPFPAGTRDPGRLWQAFACRARVLLVNTNLVPEADRPRGLFDLLHPRFKDRVAIAKPFFGTTATHAAFLFDAFGPDAAMDFFRGLKGNGVQVVAGNKPVATGIGEGRFALGLTDTDDALAEVAAGKPVAVVLPDRDGHPAYLGLRPCFLPNTVALVKGGPNPDGGRKLVDFLLRPETETRLIDSGGCQFPLHPAVTARPPGDPFGQKALAVVLATFDRVADRWDEAQTALRAEFGT
jgi:iron(III) transport system substrate-binding protein